MTFWKSHIFVHIESKYVLETYFSFFVSFNKVLVHADRRRTCGKSQNKWTICRRCSSVYLVYNIICCPLRQLLIVWLNYNSHNVYGFRIFRLLIYKCKINYSFLPLQTHLFLELKI